MPVLTKISSVFLDGKTVDITISEGEIDAIRPSTEPTQQVILPLPVDAHVHLDKTFTADRCQVTRPGLFGAIEAMERDFANWTEGDLRSRMSRALDEAWSNGFSALRSHINWDSIQNPLAWDVLGELAQEWRGRMLVQRASLTSLDRFDPHSLGASIAANVARDGEVLGVFVYRQDHLTERLENVFALAINHNLPLDFHVDEGLDAEADAFDTIVRLTAKHRLAGRVLCSHASSLSIRPEAQVSETINAAADAGVALTVLPTTNLWLQDSEQGRTPRLRGIAPMHEMRAAGMDVLLGADNVADPFFRQGSYDALSVLQLATVSAHLDPAEWLGSITLAPAKAMGLSPAAISPGAAANFMLVKGANWDDALRPRHSDRRVFRNGHEMANQETSS